MKTEELKKLFPGKVLDLPYPKPYPEIIEIPEQIKAIVLGCDPSNFSNTDGTTKELETVFAITGKNKDGRYFSIVLRNLKQVGLALSDIYVQNLCRNYFTAVTKDNAVWQEAANRWVESLKKELDDLKIPLKVPVFLTSDELYKALLKDKKEFRSARTIYNNPQLIPVNEENNLLGRPLIPLYRHIDYRIEKWEDYKNRIKEILPFI
ncbi:MAG: hypothetical protein PHT69_12795 [Bacteroidales bacterium]|nr:hypothetical protein [Bacteroidales bacterium]